MYFTNVYDEIIVHNPCLSHASKVCVVPLLRSNGSDMLHHPFF